MKNQVCSFKIGFSFLLVLMVLISCSGYSGEKGSVSGQAVERVPDIYIVEISHMTFSPAEISVKKGDKITFVNHDIVTHDVTEEFSKAWTSPPLQSQQSWTLDITASANYYCSLHPVMKGKIIVE